MYSDYLKRIELSEDKMIPTQRLQTKQAFYAGISSLMVMQREDLTTIPEDDAVNVLDSIWKECINYWAGYMPKN